MTAAAGVLVLVAVGGCVSTQTKNARTLLVNARTLASESTVRVARINPDVTVTAVDLVRDRGGSAVAVELRNHTARAVSDLPISVGVAVGRSRRYLNRRANLSYYATHVPSIDSGASALWVLTVHGHLAPAARPFATIGVPSRPASTRARSLPRIDAVLRAGAGGHELRVRLTNTSGVPQYGLQVYAVGVRDGRIRCAGHASFGTLNGGARASLRLSLLGTTRGAQLRLSAPATIFR